MDQIYIRKHLKQAHQPLSFFWDGTSEIRIQERVKIISVKVVIDNLSLLEMQGK